MDFTETITLPKDLRMGRVPDACLQTLLQSLHLVLGISYYKLYCPPTIVLKHPLTRSQAVFWETVYRKGLGEFFYRNGMDPRTRIRFPATAGREPVPCDFPRSPRALVGMGGGKDSIVALELLKEQKTDVTSFVVETERASSVTQAVVKKSGVPALTIRRRLDEKLFLELPEALRGHVPVSAMYAFLGIFAASLYDYQHVVVANEQSSNSGNVTVKGEVVNHQWSKTSEFESMFQEYTRRFITPDVTYFSLLRPFHEIRIVEMFARYPKYFSVFSSCNRNFSTRRTERPTRWCGECPKCAAVFTLLAPFLSKRELISMFGKNVFADPALEPLFKDLLGFGEVKPFECVGTFEEMRAALFLSRKKFAHDLMVKTFLLKIKRPERLVTEVFRTHVADTVPHAFRFIGMKRALLLGFGREGEVTKRYLQKTYPHLEIRIADQTRDSKYLGAQAHADIVIKTPGIPKHLVTIPYTTATNLFFAHGRGITIGVTGSKGKSTTASLIHAMLKEGGKRTHLLGNIGKPMLEALLKPSRPDDLFVLELSSYQLDDCSFSPDVAVVTTLFPEHMDYHGGEEAYYEAKKNIVRFQAERSLFVYNAHVPLLKTWVAEAHGEVRPFVKNIPISKKDISLLGAHNLENMRAAVTVAKAFGVSDAAIRRAVRAFRPLPHRLEDVGTFCGVQFIDDAISTTPESTIAALRAVPNVRTIFLGGEDRGYTFTALERELRTRGVKNVVLFPDSGKRVLKSRKGFRVLTATRMKEAVAFAYRYTPQGSVCLLSAASPSYSLWKNFEEKGDQFKHEVRSGAKRLKK